MKTYQENEHGELILGTPVSGSTTYPARFRDEINKDVADGNAVILPYVAPVKTVDELRAEEYAALGVTTDSLIIALWERDVEFRADAVGIVADIQAVRAGVKARNPKV